METLNRNHHLITVSARIFVYASVLLGVALLLQLYSVVPDWLFYSILAGWLFYLIVAVMMVRGIKLAHPAALVLAIVTLLVSLPQPEHYALLGQGFSPAALTFIAGSILQVGVIGTVAGRLILERKKVP